MIIRNDPTAKNVLTTKREKPALKPGRIECNRPIVTPKAPNVRGIRENVPKFRGPKKNNPTPIRAIAAPTEKPVHVAQRVLPLDFRTCAE